MGTLTLTELKDEIRSGLGNRTDLDDRLTRFLNLAQQRLARVYEFEELKIRTNATLPNTGSADDRFIALPSLREIYSVRLVDGTQSRKLRKLTARQWDRLFPTIETLTRRRPFAYRQWGQMIELGPIQDDSYLIKCLWTKWPTAFDNATPTNTSDFLEKDEMLIELALVYAYSSLGKEEDAQKHEKKFQRLVDEADFDQHADPDLDIISDGDVLDSPEGVAPSDYWNDPFRGLVP